MIALAALLAALQSPPVRPDGAPLVDGKPWFPVGIYHVSWVDDRMGEPLRRDLAEIARAGFDSVLCTVDLREDTRETLDAARRLGLRLIPEVNAKHLEKVAARDKDHPAVVGWIVGDDVTGELKPEELRRRIERVRAAAPGKLLYASAYNSGEAWLGETPAEAFLQTGLDAVGMQNYPIPWDPVHGRHGGFDFAPGPHAGGNHRARVFWGMKRTVDKARRAGSHAVLANLQCFRWNRKGSQWRWPTPSELSNMTYQALAAGVNGVLYYTFYDGSAATNGGSHAVERPELWAEASRLAGELRALAPAFLDGARSTWPREEDAAARVVHAAWKLADRTLVIAASVSGEAQEVALPLPGGVLGRVEAAFAGRPATLSLTNGRLSGRLAAEGVQVLWIRE